MSLSALYTALGSLRSFVFVSIIDEKKFWLALKNLGTLFKLILDIDINNKLMGGQLARD